MKVTVVPETRLRKIALGQAVGGQGHVTDQRSCLELKLHAGSALVGRGEASPLPDYSPDSLSQVRRVLEGLSPFELVLPERAESCRPLLVELSNQLPSETPSARAAFEGALAELFAVHLNCSVATLLSVVAERPESPAPELLVSRLLPSTTLEECLTATMRAYRHGYRTVKLKLSRDQDVTTWLSAIRQSCPSDLKLRLDPNGSFATTSLPELLDTLVPFEPELVEEPVSWRELVELEHSPVPLALDESLVDPLALSTLLKRRTALRLSAIVIKPTLHGLLGALELARFAEEHALDVIITHTFDGPVGHATAASLALAVGSRRYAHGIAPQPGLMLEPRQRIRGLGRGQMLHESVVGLPISEGTSC